MVETGYEFIDWDTDGMLPVCIHIPIGNSTVTSDVGGGKNQGTLFIVKSGRKGNF
jgi:hypothetical protein